MSAEAYRDHEVLDENIATSCSLQSMKGGWLATVKSMQ